MMLADVLYDEMSDDYYFVCPCGATGPGWMRWQDANGDAGRHEQQHEDGAR
ncbi:hypothetical protein [Micromonospora carbonacea]|nr:hypothetical protein [Micromonospora carbonacea]